MINEVYIIQFFYFYSYEIMLSCWNESVSKRPTFITLQSKFEHMLLSVENVYIDFSIDPEVLCCTEETNDDCHASPTEIGSSGSMNSFLFLSAHQDNKTARDHDCNEERYVHNPKTISPNLERSDQLVEQKGGKSVVDNPKPISPNLDRKEVCSSVVEH